MPKVGIGVMSRSKVSRSNFAASIFGECRLHARIATNKRVEVRTLQQRRRLGRIIDRKVGHRIAPKETRQSYAFERRRICGDRVRRPVKCERSHSEALSNAELRRMVERAQRAA
jgi:hypothetical protein